jgi:UDP-glucose 4-epimerase
VKCLVTGATGFIGRVLCCELLAQGDEVVAFSRHGHDVVPGLVSVAVDLAVEEVPAEYLAGVDTVFHLAGIAHQSASADQYDAVNHCAPLRLAHSAQALGVKHFLFLSSVKAMGPASSDTARSELDCTEPADPYGRSKLQAEDALRNEFAASSMSLAIIRPALVYGEHVKGNMQRLASAVRQGLPRPPVGGRRSMIAVQDLATLLRHVARSDRPGVNTWIACGAGSYSTQQIYQMMRTALGLSPGPSLLPRWCWRLGGGLLDRLRGNSGESTYKKLFGAELYSNQRIVADTGWKPEARLEDIIPMIMREAKP